MNIVFFDGQCGRCQRSVLFLSKLDRKEKLFFAPLYGETFQKYLSNREVSADTVVLFTEEGVFEKSEVFIKIGLILRGPWLIFVLLKLIPKKVRDALYDLVALNRSKAGRCPLPDDRRFLK